MDQEFLTNLPPQIIINILSRLPITTIMSCKCVCKPLFHLLETPEFVKSHLSKSTPGLIVYNVERLSDTFKIFEFQDELELEKHELHYIPLAKFDQSAFISPPCANISMEGSANGLLFLRDISATPHALYIINPITRECINLSNPEGMFYFPSVVTYGFGVSNMTDQYKVVRIFHECERDPQTGLILSIPMSECRVYTLGTGSWRSVPPDSSHLYNCRSNGAFLNGNLHWLVSDLKGSLSVSCFDLETERFKTFPPPPSLPERRRFLGDVGVLGDRLCLCDNTSENEIVIWVMKEYGVVKSWTKEFVISKLPDRAGECYEVVYPIKVFRDGDILMLWEYFYLFYYSNKTKTTPDLDMLDLRRSGRMEGRLHVSSFLSLKSFEMENVAKFEFSCL